MNPSQCSLEDDYSLTNTFYPLTSLDGEMERLFGSPVYQENKKCGARPGMFLILTFVTDIILND